MDRVPPGPGPPPAGPPWTGSYRVLVHQQDLHARPAVLDHPGDVLLHGQRHVHLQSVVYRHSSIITRYSVV